jgi:hypothetical protein
LRFLAQEPNEDSAASIGEVPQTRIV